MFFLICFSFLSGIVIADLNLPSILRFLSAKYTKQTKEKTRKIRMPNLFFSVSFVCFGGKFS